MTAPNAVDAGKSEGSAPSTLDAELDVMFGDHTGSSEPPEPETPETGTTPATGEPAPATPPDETAKPVDGDASKTAESAGTTPETPAVATGAEDDPFAGSETLSFTVNGTPMQFEGIAVFKDGGAVVRPEAIDLLKNRLSERESLFERNRAQSVEYQTLAKATEWTDQATNKTYTGPEAAIEMRIRNGGLAVENQLLMGVLGAEDMQPYLTTKMVLGADGQQREVVIIRPEALEQLRRENGLQQREIRAAASDYFKGELSKVQAPAVPIDFTAEAPKLIQAVAQAATLDASVLTAADITLLAKQLPWHVKDKTASLEWQDLVKDRIQLRLDAKTSGAKIASTASQATKVAQANLAAAARGVRPKTVPAKPAPRVNPAVTQQTERLDNEGQLFDAMLSAGAAAMRSS